MAAIPKEMNIQVPTSINQLENQQSFHNPRGLANQLRARGQTECQKQN